MTAPGAPDGGGKAWSPPRASHLQRAARAARAAAVRGVDAGDGDDLDDAELAAAFFGHKDGGCRAFALSGSSIISSK